MAILRESFEDSHAPAAAGRLSFSVTASSRNLGPPVIALDGRVDMDSAGELTDIVAEVLEEKPRTLIFDLSKVTFLGLAGIRVIDFARRALPAGHSVVLRHPRPRARRMLRLTHTDKLCTIED
jgi:anti-anti-sigma factor